MKQIKEILEQKKKGISFEFFPPKTEKGEVSLFNHLQRLESVHPLYVSVTYGAGGSTREKTRTIVNKMAADKNLNVMAHLTCVGQTEKDILDILDEYSTAGVQNILALRGDIPVDQNPTNLHGDFPHAIDLVRTIRQHYKDRFSIGVAAFPERHLESPNMEWEIRYFKEKVAAGANFAVTQMFFDNRFYFEFLNLATQASIDIPIIPGIMPVTNFKQIRKFAQLSGAHMPDDLVQKLSAVEDQPENIRKIGIDYAVKQCTELLDAVPYLHFFTLNRSGDTLDIHKEISHLL